MFLTLDKLCTSRTGTVDQMQQKDLDQEEREMEGEKGKKEEKIRGKSADFTV